MFVAFLFCLIIWFWALAARDKRVFSIHYLMALLVFLKCCSLFFQAMDYHNLAITGRPGGWAIAYYVFAGLKGIMLFVVILLIGTGWSFIKSYLNDSEKKLFLAVISLQVIDNIALVIIDETAPGSQQWFTWLDIFRLVDVICCGAILVPIMWSINQLRDAAQTDGKAARNIEKLQQFRTFYVLVISYVYVTRIIVYLFSRVLPYPYVWLSSLSTELAALVFYVLTGYMFRPTNTNPYLHLEEDVTALEMVPNAVVSAGHRNPTHGTE